MAYSIDDSIKSLQTMYLKGKMIPNLKYTPISVEALDMDNSTIHDKIIASVIENSYKLTWGKHFEYINDKLKKEKTKRFFKDHKENEMENIKLPKYVCDILDKHNNLISLTASEDAKDLELYLTTIQGQYNIAYAYFNGYEPLEETKYYAKHIDYKIMDGEYYVSLAFSHGIFLEEKMFFNDDYDFKYAFTEKELEELIYPTVPKERLILEVAK